MSLRSFAFANPIGDTPNPKQPTLSLIYVDKLPDELVDLELDSITIERIPVSSYVQESQQQDEALKADIKNDIIDSLTTDGDGRASIRVMVVSSETNPTIFKELLSKEKSRKAGFFFTHPVELYDEELIHQVHGYDPQCFYGLDQLKKSIPRLLLK